MPTRNIVVVALAIIVSLACYSSSSKNRYANIFATAMQIVEDEALVEQPREELFDAAMDGMLAKIDENSGYISEEDYKIFEEDINQEFVGVGMNVQAKDEKGCVRVVAPIPGTPAFRAGMQSGDLILAIDGQSTNGLGQNEAVKLIRGPKGEPVDLLIERKEIDEPFTVTIVRDSIPISAINGDTRNADGSWNLFLHDHPEIAYIRLQRFGERTTDELREALGNVRDDAQALILDLRDNPGGLLEKAVDVSDMFIDREVLVVLTKKRNNRIVERKYATSKTEIDPDIPMVVMINQYSASASEIVAACLQDHKRAVVVGQRSYGKGTVQELIPLENNRSVMRLTTASYWRPNGNNIDRTIADPGDNGHWGVEPNPGFEVALAEEDLRAYYMARNQRDQTIVDELDQSDPATNPWENADPQLKRAIEHLKLQIQKNSAAAKIQLNERIHVERPSTKISG